MKKYATRLFAVLAAVMILFAGCTAPSGESGTVSADTTQSTVQAQRQSDGGVTLSNDSAKSFDYNTVPKFDDKPYVEINGNVPYFTKSELTTKSYESYGELDKYGRCTMCIASVGTDLMPTEERGAIGSIKPTGWHTVKYSNVDKYQNRQQGRDDYIFAKTEPVCRARLCLARHNHHIYCYKNKNYSLRNTLFHNITAILYDF